MLCHRPIDRVPATASRTAARADESGDALSTRLSGLGHEPDVHSHLRVHPQHQDSGRRDVEAADVEDVFALEHDAIALCGDAHLTRDRLGDAVEGEVAVDAKSPTEVPLWRRPWTMGRLTGCLLNPEPLM